MKGSTHTKKISNPVKNCFLIGSYWFVGIDSMIARKLGVTENNTLFEQEMVKNGIIMKVIKLDDDAETSQSTSPKNDSRCDRVG